MYTGKIQCLNSPTGIRVGQHADHISFLGWIQFIGKWHSSIAASYTRTSMDSIAWHPPNNRSAKSTSLMFTNLQQTLFVCRHIFEYIGFGHLCARKCKHSSYFYTEFQYCRTKHAKFYFGLDTRIKRSLSRLNSRIHRSVKRSFTTLHKLRL